MSYTLRINQLDQDSVVNKTKLFDLYVQKKNLGLTFEFVACRDMDRLRLHMAGRVSKWTGQATPVGRTCQRHVDRVCRDTDRLRLHMAGRVSKWTGQATPVGRTCQRHVDRVCRDTDRPPPAHDWTCQHADRLGCTRTVQARLHTWT
jgi:hypothetical protein